MTLQLSILALAYLLGSIPFGYLLVRFFRKEDIRAIGSGNIGATNVARSGAKGLGLLTLALDALKGATAVYIAAHFAPPVLTPNGDGAASNLAIAAAVIAVLGHVFPVWLRFKGGKGIATALGVFIALVPAVALASFLVFLIVVLLTRYVSLGSILAAASIPLLAVFLVPAHTPALLLGLCIISITCILKHHANIARLRSGTESRFGKKPSKETEKSLNRKTPA